MDFGLFSSWASKREDTVDPADTPTEEVIQVATADEAVKEEAFLSSLLEVTQRVYYEQGLNGSIYVSRSFIFYQSSLNCEVHGSSEEQKSQKLTETLAKELTMFERKVMSTVRGAVLLLKNRARAYRNKEYRKDLTLSCGISVTDPFFGLMSTTISCSAKVSTLLGEGHHRNSKSLAVVAPTF